MITYELAKKLKEAGFPFREVPKIIQDQPNAGWFTLLNSFVTFGNESYFVPTLSELIKNCKNDFVSLVLDEDMGWTCYGHILENKEDTDYVVGETPEESVVNLWLVLNKKK